MNLKDKLKLMMLSEAKKEKEPIWCEYLEADDRQQLEPLPAYYNPARDSYRLNFFISEVPNKASLFIVSDGTTGTSFVDYTANEQGKFFHRIKNPDGQNVWTAIPDLTAGKHALMIRPRANTLDSDTVTAVAGIDESSTQKLALLGSATTIYPMYRLYGFQYYKDGTLTLNLRPCLHPETLRPAMYDTVEGKYYYNQGTGEFKYKIGFTKLDYLESTSYEHNANYIDTLIIPTERMSFNIKLQVKYNSWDRPFGADNGYRCEMHSREGFRMTWQYTTVAIPASQTEPFVFTQNKNLCYVNGELVNTFGNYPFTCKVPLRLFSCTDGTRDAICKIYYCEISEEDILKRDYIPVRMNDGRLGMWDFVTGEFFANLGTVKFKGYLNGYQVGESLKGDGTQYIDTGINANYKRTYTYTYMSCEAPGSETTGAFGSRVTYGKECTNAFCVAGITTFTLRLDMLSPNIVTPNIDKNKLVECISNGEKTIVNNQMYTTEAKPDKTAPFTDYIFNINSGNKLEVKGFTGSYTNWLVITDNIPQLSLIPVKKDSFIGMIDTLTGKEYPNMGTGEFIFKN